MAKRRSIRLPRSGFVQLTEIKELVRLNIIEITTGKSRLSKLEISCQKAKYHLSADIPTYFEIVTVA